MQHKLNEKINKDQAQKDPDQNLQVNTIMVLKNKKKNVFLMNEQTSAKKQQK